MSTQLNAERLAAITERAESDGAYAASVSLLVLPDNLRTFLSGDLSPLTDGTSGPLSGEWSDNPTAESIADDLGLDQPSYDDATGEPIVDSDEYQFDLDLDTIADTYENAYYTTFFEHFAMRILAAYGLSLDPTSEFTAVEALDRLGDHLNND